MTLVKFQGIYEKLNKLVARFRERELQNGGRNNRNLDPSGSDNNRYEDNDDDYGFDDDFEEKSLPSPTASVEHVNGQFTVSPSPNMLKYGSDKVDNLDLAENSMESSSYAEIYDDDTRSSIHSATKIRHELAELKVNLKVSNISTHSMYSVNLCAHRP